MHSWGDKDFDWNSLNCAIGDIVKYLKLFRVPVRQYKEKYGTARIYCQLGWSCLLDITHPGYYSYYPYPKWLSYLDIFYLSHILVRFNFIIYPIHKWAYRKAYYNAVKKYPHIKKEICCCADYVELLDFYKQNRI